MRPRLTAGASAVLHSALWVLVLLGLWCSTPPMPERCWNTHDPDECALTYDGRDE